MFVWTREVDKVEGNTVVFKDGGTAQYTDTALKYVLTEEAIEESELQMNTVDAVAADIIRVFEDHDIRFFDVGLILQKVKWSCDAYNDRTMSKAAGLLDEFDGNVDKQVRNIRVSHVKNFLNS